MNLLSGSVHSGSKKSLTAVYVRAARIRFARSLCPALFLLVRTFGAHAQALEKPLNGTLHIAGTDTMKDLMDRWIAAFTADHPGVIVDMAAKGALTAGPALSSGSVDLVTLGRELTPPELAEFHHTHSYDPTVVRVALGSYDVSGKTVALAFYVNAANPVAKLSLTQIGAIYCKSAHSALTWADVGVTGTWADHPIHPIGVNFPDGISNFVRLKACNEGDLRTDIRTEHTGGPVNVLERITRDVTADPDAIGYAGFANAMPGAKAIAISEDGKVASVGTRADVANATYPFTRFIYLYLDRAPGAPVPPLSLAFLQFITSPRGQALVATDGVYLPLPSDVLVRERALLGDSTGSAEMLRAPADPALPHYVPEPGISGHLTSVGSDTMDDLMNLWKMNFGKLQTGVKIELKSQASLSVPAALTSGIAQLAPMSRELNPTEVAAFHTAHGYAPTEIAVALGSYNTPTRTVALTFYVNDANPLQRLNLQQLDAMWCTSLLRGGPAQITEWGHLGLTGDWEHRPIHLVGVLPPDGVPNFISRRICAGGPLRNGIATEKNGGPTSVLTRIVADVANDPAAIGYAGFHNRLPGTHPLALAETARGPYLTGSFDEVRSAEYPLTRFVYLYLDLPPGKPVAEPLASFLRYVLSLEGQKQVEAEGVFLPLPANVASRERRKLFSEPSAK